MKSSFIRTITVFTFCGASIISAQESINYASISGRVTDPSGAVVQDAQVTARQTETNLTSSTIQIGKAAFDFRI